MSGRKGYRLEDVFRARYKLPPEDVDLFALIKQGIMTVSWDKPEEFAKQKHKIMKLLLEDYDDDDDDDDDLHHPQYLPFKRILITGAATNDPSAAKASRGCGGGGLADGGPVKKEEITSLEDAEAEKLFEESAKRVCVEFRDVADRKRKIEVLDSKDCPHAKKPTGGAAQVPETKKTKTGSLRLKLNSKLILRAAAAEV